MSNRRLLSLTGLHLVVACLVSQGCALAGMKVSGQVVDVGTGRPIAGAYVLATSGRDEFCAVEGGRCHCVALTADLTRTDKNGFYSFDKQFSFGIMPTSKFGYVVVYKRGYIDAPPPQSDTWSYTYSTWHLARKYFYGSGDYKDDFEFDPLTKSNNAYYLSTRKVGDIRNFKPKDATPRIVYLSYIAHFGVCRYKNGSQATLMFPMKRAMYEEAVSLAKTEKDHELVDQICREARGQIDDDKPCHIEDGPAR